MRHFLRAWHKLLVYRGWQVELPLSVKSALRCVASVRTWTCVSFCSPNTQTLAAKDITSKAYASAPRERFDTVLVHIAGGEEAGAGGLDNIRVGQLRAIFAVQLADERGFFADKSLGVLAFVDWFILPSCWMNCINGMHEINRSRRPDSAQESGIIELVDIRRACQLVPQFGSQRVDRKLTPLSIMNEYDGFYLNNRLDKDMYRNTYWKESEDDSE